MINKRITLVATPLDAINLKLGIRRYLRRMGISSTSAKAAAKANINEKSTKKIIPSPSPYAFLFG